MLAGRLNMNTHEFDVMDVPLPEPGPGQVRIKVEAAGVCLSDVHLIDGTLNFGAPEGGIVTLGHEVAGSIDVLGPEVNGWKRGQRVLLKGGERSPDMSKNTQEKVSKAMARGFGQQGDFELHLGQRLGDLE